MTGITKLLRLAVRATLSATTLAVLVGCGPAPASEPAAPAKGRPDICEGSPPLDKQYTGLLKSARCEQDKFLKMADISAQLGVDCDYCHIKDPSTPDKFDYVTSTPNREIAAWMGSDLMASVKPAKEGGRFRCKSCHGDEAGKPLAKVLGNPRDPEKAHAWMTRVMVTDFVTKDDSKLTCKACHGDAPNQPGFQAHIMLKAELPPPH